MTASRSLFLALLAAPFGLLAQPAIRYIEPDPATGSSKAVIYSDRALLHTTQILPHSGGTPSQQAGFLMTQLGVMLREAGQGEAVPVRLEWCLRDTASRAAVQEAMARTFSGVHKPAAIFVIGQLRDAQASMALNAVAVSGPGRAGAKPTIISTSVGTVSVVPAGGLTQISGQAQRGKTRKDSTLLTLASLFKTLEFLGLTRADALQFKIFLQPMETAGQVTEAFQEAFGAGTVPPLVFVEWLSAQPSVEIEMVAAAAPAQVSPGSRRVAYLTPPHLKAPIAYSKVVTTSSSDFIYVSTLTAKKPGDGAAQARDIFAQLQGVLAEAGGNFDQLLKATYYTSDADASKGLVDLRPSVYGPTRAPAASKASIRSIGVDGRTLALDMIAVPR